MILNKKVRRFLWIVLIILIFLGIGFLIFKFMIPQAMFIPGLTIQTETTTWKGIDVELKSTHFGSITSGPATGDICGDNDGHITLSNSYSTGEKFSLSSSQTGSDPCNAQNGIEARMIIPARGKIIGYSDNIGNSPIGSGPQISSRSKVTITKGLTTLFNDDLNIPARQGGKQSSKDFEIIFDVSTEITISVNTWGPGGGGSSSAKIFFELIEYEPEPPEPIPPEPIPPKPTPPEPIPPEPTPPIEYCGDGICNGQETSSDCPEDCEIETPRSDYTPLLTLIAGIFLGIVVFIFITVLIIRRRR